MKRRAKQLLKRHQKTYIPQAIDGSVRRGQVLVFSPHPDDETLGCGGTLALHARGGDPIHVVTVTDGALGFQAQAAVDYVARRAAESEAAFEVLGVRSSEFWGYPDQGLVVDDALLGRFKDCLERINPAAVYAPSVDEIHPDHLHVAVSVQAALAAVRRPIQLMEYEVGNPLAANLLVDVTSTIAIKEQAIRCYPSQLQGQPLLEKALALNRYRSVNFEDLEITYVEAFRSTHFG